MQVTSVNHFNKVFENGGEGMFGLQGLEYDDEKRIDCLCL
jgi:hypothetical protein